MRVAVVGAGVIGLTSAIAVKTAFPDYEIDIFADELSPDTTGDGSAGFWTPYLLGDTPPEDISRWAGKTHRWLEKLWKSDQAMETGISLIPVYRLTKNVRENSCELGWIDLAYGRRKISGEELKKLSEEHRSSYKEGWQFLTYTSEPVRLLPWLTEKFVAAGGRIRRRKIRALHELIDVGYNLIINCCGLGARELVGDSTVTPIRGQVSRVMASWAMHAYIVDDDDGNYIIPNMDSVVLGGTHQVNDFDRSVRKEDSKFIHDGCCKILPGLKEAEIMKEWVGLRPARPRVRLESEILRSPRGQEFMVIHNYGHGGSGVTLCWGCALDVVEIVRKMKTREIKPKL